MVTPSATALGRPLEPVVSAVTSIIGAGDDASAQVSSRKGTCVWVAMAVAILLAEGSFVYFVRPKPFCEFDTDGTGSVLVDARMLLPSPLLFPWFSGAVVTMFIVRRHRYIVGSKLHFWTCCYAVAMFVYSWIDVLGALCYCSGEHQTLLTVSRQLGTIAFVFTTVLLIWMSVVKLRCLKSVAPSLARVGEMFALVFVVGLAFWTFSGQSLASPVFAAVLAVLAIALAAFYGVFLMVLGYSAKSAFNEASQSDVDVATSRHLTISASWTRWTLIVTACAGSTVFANGFIYLNRTRDGSALAILVCYWAFDLDRFSNVAACAFLSGLLFGDSGREDGTTILRDVAASVDCQERRQIEQQLIKAVGASAGSALTVAYLMDGVAPTDVLREAEPRFRCITWKALAPRSDIIIGGGPLDVVGPGGDDLYSLSEPCDLGSCDAFVSHSWHDDCLQKWEALRSWCDDFLQTQGYHPRLWIDKICLCQREIATDLRCLPIFLAGCKRLLIISGPTYPTRLWCAMEVLVHRAILASDANRCPPELLPLGDDEQRKDLQQAWGNFDVDQCNCFNPEDKRRFLLVVGRYPGGSTGFNSFIHEFAADLSALSEVSSPTDDDDYAFVADC